MYPTLYQTTLPSPVGALTLVCNAEQHLVGLWLAGQKYFYGTLSGKPLESADLPVFLQTRAWLEAYFAGRRPAASELPPLSPAGSAFRQRVWRILQAIPYGSTTTYGAIAQQIAAETGKPTMSAQAVGGAVGHNPISILIPCHRVIGADGSLTGYAGGIPLKAKLLRLEGMALPQ